VSLPEAGKIEEIRLVPIFRFHKILPMPFDEKFCVTGLEIRAPASMPCCHFRFARFPARL
jgi:hypothetical protein